MRDERAAHFFLTLLTGLALTAYLSWFSYRSAQEAAAQQLIDTGSAISQTLERELLRLERLPDFIAQLNAVQRQQSIHLFPYLLAADMLPSDPNSQTEGGQIPKPRSKVSREMDDQGRARAVETRRLMLPSGELQLSVNLTEFLTEATAPFASVPVSVSIFDLRTFAQDPFVTLTLGPESDGRDKLPQWLEELSYSSSLGAPQRDWLLRIQPRAAFNTQAQSGMPLLVFIAGCLISALLAQIVRLRANEAADPSDLPTQVP